NQQQRKAHGFREKSRVDQEEAAEGHRDDAAGRQDTVRHGLQVDDEEQDREQDQENTGNVDGQVEERQGGQQARDDADDTRKDESGVGYPEADTDDGQQEEEVDEVGVGDRLQQLIEA